MAVGSSHWQLARGALGTALGVGVGLACGRWMFAPPPESRVEIVHVAAPSTEPAAAATSPYASTDDAGRIAPAVAPSVTELAPPAPGDLAHAEAGFVDAEVAHLDEIVDRRPRSAADEMAVRSSVTSYEPVATGAMALRELTCTAEICRFVLDHTEAGAGHVLVRELGARGGLVGATFTHERELADGTRESLVYLGLHGFALPLVDMADGT